MGLGCLSNIIVGVGWAEGDAVTVFFVRSAATTFLSDRFFTTARSKWDGIGVINILVSELIVEDV